MNKIDYKKELKHLYRPSSKKVEAVVVPKMNFLMVDGAGAPLGSRGIRGAGAGPLAKGYLAFFFFLAGLGAGGGSGACSAFSS